MEELLNKILNTEIEIVQKDNATVKGLLIKTIGDFLVIELHNDGTTSKRRLVMMDNVKTLTYTEKLTTYAGESIVFGDTSISTSSDSLVSFGGSSGPITNKNKKNKKNETTNNS